MPVYLVATLEVRDPAQFKSYVTDVPAIVAKFGGRFLVRGGEPEVVDGEWPMKRVTVIEFPSMEKAKEWWDSAEYAPFKQLRQRTARTNAVFVPGYSA